MTAKWTPESELYYKTNCTKKHLVEGQIKPRYDFFEVDKVVGDKNVDVVIDVGGGPHGGAMFYYKGGIKRVLFDSLADKYFYLALERPDDIEFVKGDFGDIPFADSFADVIFAWEVLDHALSLDHFRAGQNELVRILAKDGLLFFAVPIRGKEEPHHFNVEINEVQMGFSKLKLLRKEITTEPMGMLVGKQLWCIYTK